MPREGMAEGTSGGLQALPLFDGKCPASRGSNLVLRFDEGAELRAHSFVLDKASKVLAEALDLEHQGQIELTGTSPQIWRILLGILYSPWAITFDLETVELEQLEDVLIQADKYNIRTVREQCEEHIEAKAKTANLQDLCKYFTLALKVHLPHLPGICGERIPRIISERLDTEGGSVEDIEQETNISGMDNGIRDMVHGFTKEMQVLLERIKELDNDPAVCNQKYRKLVEAVEKKGFRLSKKGNLVEL